MLMGVHESLSPSSLKAKYPGVRLTRAFVGGVQTDPNKDIATSINNYCAADWAAGLIPVLSIKTPPVDTADGRFDAFWDRVATHLLSQPESWLIYYHEPEDNMTGVQFSAAFNRVRSRVKAIAPNQKVGYSAMAYQWGHTGAGNVNSDAEAKSWVVDADFYGCDVYSGDSEPASTLISDHPGYVRWLSYVLPKARALGAEVGLTERGWWKSTHTDSQRALYIRQEKELLKDVLRSETFYIYWNTDGTQGDPSLVAGPIATEAIKELVAELSQKEEGPSYLKGYADGYQKGLEDLAQEIRQLLDEVV